MSRQILAWAVAVAVGMGGASFAVAADAAGDMTTQTPAQQSTQTHTPSWDASSSMNHNTQTLEGRLVNLRTYAMAHLNDSASSKSSWNSNSAKTGEKSESMNTDSLKNESNKSATDLSMSANANTPEHNLDTGAAATPGATAATPGATGANADLSTSAKATTPTTPGATAGMSGTSAFGQTADAPYGIEANGKVYTVVADPNELVRYQGQEVRITGHVEKSADLLVPTKFEVKQNGSYQPVALLSIQPMGAQPARTANEQ